MSETTLHRDTYNPNIPYATIVPNQSSTASFPTVNYTSSSYNENRLFRIYKGRIRRNASNR